MIESGERTDDGLILAICSVELEMRPLLDRMETPESIETRRTPGWVGRAGGRDVLLVAGGMGKTNAAHTLTLLLERRRIAGIIGFGVGGAFLSAGLAPGDVAVATEEIYGDEGVATPAGWLSCEGIGIPLHSHPEADLFNRFPVDAPALPEVIDALRSNGATVDAGPFVTVSCCSGTTARGNELAARFGAVCESMEGAAYAHVAAIYGVPFLEIRGVSNRVEDRDLSRWRLAAGAEAAARAVLAALPVWRPTAGGEPRA